MTRRLILLRHGQTAHNATSRMQGRLDTELSDVGIAQAEAVAEILAHDNIIKIVSSDLSRALKTATIIGDRIGLEPVLEPRLQETALGDWQGMSTSEVDEQYPGARARWVHDAFFRPPGGESRLDVAARTRPVVDELMETFPDWDHGTVLMVAHGGVLRALTGSLLGFSHDQYPLLSSMGNTHRVELLARPRFDPSKIMVDEEGDPMNPVAVFDETTIHDPYWYLNSWNRGHDLVGGVVPRTRTSNLTGEKTAGPGAA